MAPGTRAGEHNIPDVNNVQPVFHLLGQILDVLPIRGWKHDRLHTSPQRSN